MMRRDFLVCAGGLFVWPLTSIGRSNDDFIREMNRSHRDYTDAARVLRASATGWSLNISEDRSWDLFGWNKGPRKMRFSLAKPKEGDWVLIKQLEIAGGAANQLLYQWKPDNEDVFIFAEAQNAQGFFSPISGEVSNANAGLLQNQTICDMSWTAPQELHLKLQATPLR